MSALNDLGRRLEAANTALHHERTATATTTAAPRRRRGLVLAGTVASLTAALTVGGLAVQRDGHAPAALPGAVSAMADQIAARRGILHVVSGSSRSREGTGAWQTSGTARDEAWVDLDRGGWRDRVIDDGRITSDALQRPDGTELTQRRSGDPRVDTATRGLPAEQLLPRQAWGGFVGARLRGIGELRETGRTTIDGRPAVVVRQQDVDDLDYRYAFDAQTGALRRIDQRIPLRGGGVYETQTTIEHWEVLPRSPELQDRLSVLNRLGQPVG